MRSHQGSGNVQVERFRVLPVDFCEASDITAVVKGLRAVSNVEYEMQVAPMTYRLAKIETRFMMTQPVCSFFGSSLVKEIAEHGGEVSGLVPEPDVSRLHGRPRTCGGA